MHWSSGQRNMAQDPDHEALEHDVIKWNRHHALALCLSMIFSENRFPLFRIML